MELRGRDEEHTSRNVVSFIEGTEFPHKEILFTAHYDSILFGDGAWDNASGSANIMEIYRHYLASPPRHSMRFIWCGAEEQGLLGSKAYVEAHPEELDKILLCENFDMTGTILGSHNLILAGTEELKYYIKFIAKESGFVTRLTEDVHHSDSSPFANKGIPAIGYTRGGYSSYHTRYDKLWPLSAERLNESRQFAITVTDRIDKLEDTVFERAVSSTMAEKLKNYIEPKD